LATTTKTVNIIQSDFAIQIFSTNHQHYYALISCKVHKLYINWSFLNL